MDVKDVLKEFSLFLDGKKYIGLKQYDEFISKYKYLLDNIDSINCELEDKNKIKRIFNDKNKLLKNNNLKYLDTKTKEYKDYFDHLFDEIDPNIKLDDNQRQAIIAEEDNLIIVAGAGSGKTTTMAAKVKYLVDKCHVRQSEIVVISFTKKVANEIRTRIYDGFGLKNVDVYTFHSLGVKIINQATKLKYSIIDDKGKYKVISNYIKNVLFRDKELFNKFIKCFKSKTRFSDEWVKFDNFEEYHNFEYNKKLKNTNFNVKKYVDYEISRRRNYYKSINGEYLRSHEEVDIANFLYKNGIDYEYEKPYNKNYSNNRQYQPDFYISQLENYNYIEHFGIDQNNKNTMYDKETLKSYVNNMKFKMHYHAKCDNARDLIMTFSKSKDGRSYLEHLKEQLENNGYSLMPKSDIEIFNRLKETSQDGYFNDFIDKLVVPFISLFKAQNYVREDFDRLISEECDDLLKDELQIMKNIYIYYEDYLTKNYKIDFDDMINKAYRLIKKVKEEDMGIDYNYIIIDEYQDISCQRYNLTKRLSELFDAKIFAVGDDWQSIFGFAGSDINLFTNFKEYLYGAKMIPINNTYRNSQELIDIAHDFILKNKNQIDKNLFSMKHLDNPVEILRYEDKSKYKKFGAKEEALIEAIEQIYKDNPKGNILILGRYNSDRNFILNSSKFSKRNDEQIKYKKYPHLRITFLTIHKSKGLGFDNCILVNADDSRYGFPSKIEDDPLIKLIKPSSKEIIDYPEERRLLYVALTRTKNKLYIIVPNSKCSSFVIELKDYKNVRVSKEVIKNSDNYNKKRLESYLTK